VQIDDPLVDSHLELVPGLGTLSARSLSGGDSQGLGWHSDGSLDLEVLVLSSSDEVTAHLLQRLDIPGGECDTDSVDWDVLLNTFSILVSVHCGRVSVSLITPALNLESNSEIENVLNFDVGLEQNSCFTSQEEGKNINHTKRACLCFFGLSQSSDG